MNEPVWERTRDRDRVPAYRFEWWRITLLVLCAIHFFRGADLLIREVLAWGTR